MSHTCTRIIFIVITAWGRLEINVNDFGTTSVGNVLFIIEIDNIYPTYRSFDCGHIFHQFCNAAEVNVISEKSSWCRNEQLCQGMKCTLLTAVRRTGYCAT